MLINGREILYMYVRKIVIKRLLFFFRVTVSPVGQLLHESISERGFF